MAVFSPLKTAMYDNFHQIAQLLDTALKHGYTLCSCLTSYPSFFVQCDLLQSTNPVVSTLAAYLQSATRL